MSLYIHDWQSGLAHIACDDTFTIPIKAIYAGPAYIQHVNDDPFSLAILDRSL